MAFPKWLTFGRALLTAIALVTALVIWQLPALDHEGRSLANVLAVGQMAVLVIGLYSIQLVAQQARQAAEQTRLTAEQTRLASEQAIQTAKWNKLLSYHQFFGELITTPMVKAMLAVAAKHGFKDCMDSLTPMSKDSVKKLEEDEDSLKDIQAYLDEFEEFCGAVHAGVTDSEYAYTLEATRVIRAWSVFEPYIRSQRARHPYSRCYLELERLGGTWKDRRESEARQKNSQDGVKPCV